MSYLKAVLVFGLLANLGAHAADQAATSQSCAPSCGEALLEITPPLPVPAVTLPDSVASFSHIAMRARRAPLATGARMVADAAINRPLHPELTLQSDRTPR